ncbi:hypothetical protein FCU45_06450 [Sulfurimonas crateris]|uniref:Transformation system protein n=1 Tax=Sulfurimonas crateris TaxID=2574727 RepID=A0A4U2Z6U1_9BACT|nr:CDC27 family protein [Sulfurimonas crateris]TKI69694.1 hypothetical protein FCU45_06450 [Sulfurimonas crateris]
MLNVDELESKHKKYKLKSYTPYFAIFLGVSAAILSISFFLLYDFNSKKETKKELIAQKIQNYNEEKKADIVIENKNELLEQNTSTAIMSEDEKEEEPMALEREKKVQLSPSLNFIKRIESETPVYKKEHSVKTAAVETKVEKPIEKSIENKKEEVSLPVVEEVKESIALVQKPTANTSTIDITRRDVEEDIKHVIKRFNVNHNPALSLFVAVKYYQLENYEQAYNYALATNELNNNIEASWIIFSKSLVKLGKKEMAIETLKKYIKHSDSSQARQLLDEILSGKFK